MSITPWSGPVFVLARPLTIDGMRAVFTAVALMGWPCIRFVKYVRGEEDETGVWDVETALQRGDFERCVREEALCGATHYGGTTI